MNYKKAILILSIGVFALELVFPKSITASHILLEENFDDGNSQDNSPTSWNEINSNFGYWSINQNGMYRGYVPNNSDGSISTLTGDVLWDDYEFEIDITGVQGPDRHIQFRLDLNRPPGRKGYALKYLEGSHIELQRAGTGVVAVNNEFKSSIGETHRLKVVAKGKSIKVFEGQKLLLDYTDNNPDAYLNGQIGMFTERGALTNETLYDNILVKHISSSNNYFELPFDYPNRNTENNEESFLETFNDRVTSVFDHEPEKLSITNYKNENYHFSDCFKNQLNDHNLDCYDAHRGYDFKPNEKNVGESVYPAYGGQVEYVTPDCTKELSGYGCFVILSHSIDSENYYTLYGHLSSISVIEDQEVNIDDELGLMGNTGKSTGMHLHFSVLKSQIINQIGLNYFYSLKDKDWELLVDEVKDKEKINLLKPNTSQCNFTSNNLHFNFIDPSGWDGDTDDPWEIQCDVENILLWKYSLSE